MSAPLRALCYVDDSTTPEWMITSNQGKSWTRPHCTERITTDRLIREANGLNDVETERFFKKSQQARFQPAR